MPGIRKTTLPNRREILEIIQPDEKASDKFFNYQRILSEENKTKYLTIDEICDQLDISRVVFEKKFINAGLPHLKITYQVIGTDKTVEPRPSILIDMDTFVEWMLKHLPITIAIRDWYSTWTKSPVEFPDNIRDIGYRICKKEDKFILIKNKIVEQKYLYQVSPWIYEALVTNKIWSLKQLQQHFICSKTAARLNGFLLHQITIDNYKRYIVLDLKTGETLTAQMEIFNHKLFYVNSDQDKLLMELVRKQS